MHFRGLNLKGISWHVMGDVCAGFLKLEVGLTARTAMNLTRTHVCPPSTAPPVTVLSTAPSYRVVAEAMAKVATVGREGGRNPE